MPAVKINEKEYEFAPLKVKHLRRMIALLSEKKDSGLFKMLDRWSPFVFESIKAKNPDFKEDELNEATLEELSAAWDTIVKASGIKFITAEKPPVDESASDEPLPQSVQ